MADTPAGWSRRGLSARYQCVYCGCELLHELILPLLHFLGREIFLVRRDRPLVPVRVGEGSAAIAPELIRHLPHGPGSHLRARRDGAVEQRVAVLHVEPERRRRAADRLGAFAPPIASFSMMSESPMRISACMIFPSGPTARATSSAPSAFLYQSMACAALSRVSCGVTVWCPSGTAFFAFAMSTSFASNHEPCIVL